MSRPRILTGVLLIVVFAAPFSKSQNSIPNSPQGFQQQYHAAFERFQAHKDSELQAHLDTFAIPARWFSEMFIPDQASELAEQYAKEFAEFKKRTAANFADIDPLKARLNIDSATPTDIRTRRWTAAEDTTSMQHPPGLRAPLPQAQKFAIDVVATSGAYGRLTSSIETFVYLDGAFRYFGRQGRPFWMRKP
jgi:hypothetical protein